MLLVKTSLSPSPIHGSGLFAAEDIAQSVDPLQTHRGSEAEEGGLRRVDGTPSETAAPSGT